MQTFLPYSDFKQSARCLDYRRLGKQRVECKQILRALRRKTGRYSHPAVKMWEGYESALRFYMRECIREWRRRGYRNSMTIIVPGAIKLPHWFGDERFHASHRSNLLRKDLKYYSQFGWGEPLDLPYYWPTKGC